jgi:aminomethyltransferase
MVPFAGWELPLEFTGGVSAEHLAVRARAGLFDVSHMGELELAGRDALPLVQRLTCNDASRLAVGQAQYSALTTESGTIIDDLLVYRLAGSHFLLVVNAANAARDAAWIREEAKAFGDVALVDTSSRYALLALQGPASAEVLQELTGVVLADLEAYRFTHGEVAGARATISRTGYTGEDGFEIFVAPQVAVKVWDAVLREGQEAGVVPAGLAARDTLRLEAAFRLHGQDIDDSTTVLEAGLGWIVAWEKGEFNGRAALAAQKAAGPPRRLVGFEMDDRAIGRHGHDVYADGVKVGVVTSGTRTPFLKKAIGMARVPSANSSPGTRLEIDVRGRRAAARVVPLPFYKRSKR